MVRLINGWNQMRRRFPWKQLIRMEIPMPMATTCLIGEEVVFVDDAIELRDEAKRLGQPKPDFRCTQCGKAVRPHRGSKYAAAHIEHRERNIDCPLSHRTPR